jgi:hypothetical protein
MLLEKQKKKADRVVRLYIGNGECVFTQWVEETGNERRGERESQTNPPPGGEISSREFLSFLVQKF